MWIKSKIGLFNADNFIRFEEIGNTTFGFDVVSATPKAITHSRVLNKIAEALENNIHFLEVE